MDANAQGQGSRQNPHAARDRAVSLALGVVVAGVYLALASGVTGPAYLRDEIGYLGNAAFLGGRHVDGASSYYAGYSLLLAPLFHFLDDPASVWRGVMIVNAAMWGVSLALLHAITRRLFPHLPRRRVLLAVLLAAAYPANAVMSGYAFSQGAVAMVFMASVASLFAVDPQRPRTVIAHAVLAALLSWVHPVGIVAPLASWLALLTVTRAPGRHRLLWLHALVALAVVLAYRLGVDPWRIAAMTPAGASADLHYPALREVGTALASPTAWLTPLASLLGQLAYSAVASFGATVIAAIAILRQGGWRAPLPAGDAARALAVRWYVLLVPLACIAATALTTANGTPTRLDHWLYGRYQDALILPLLAYGLLCERRRWQALAIAAAVALIGVWISHGMHATGSPNRVNLSGLWPETFLPAGSVAIWLAWGAAGIVLFQFTPRVLAWAGALVLYALSIQSQRQWHAMLLQQHSNPSEVVDFVRGNFPAGCVYFDAASVPANQSPYSPMRERALMYAYYFFAQRYDHGNHAGRWLASPCRGALLSYDTGWSQRQPALHLVGRESASGLRVWVKDDPAHLRYPPRPTDGVAESDWITWMGAACLQSGDCLHNAAPALARMSQVGRLRGAWLESDGRAGFLFFGPYRPLRAGRYELQLQGRASRVGSAYVDVAAQGARAIYLKQMLAVQPGASLGRWQFDLPQDVADAQVRVWVGAGEQLAVSDYTLVRLDAGAPPSPQTPSP
jgi:hypothetical protein